jgi:predicted secreted protein
MAGNVGREFELQKNGTPLLGLRDISVEKAEGEINITTGEDDGWQLLLDPSSERSINISFSGISKDNVIRDIVMSGSPTLLLTDVTLVYPIYVNGNTTNATLTGNFRINGITDTGPYNDACTFDATLMSSGPMVFTAEAA